MTTRLIILLLAVSFYGRAATYICANGTLATVQSNVNLTVDGDTVTVPAGSNTWTGTLTVARGISLIGAGTNQTIVVDGGADAIQLISWGTVSNTFPRLSGFTFQGNGNGIKYSGSVIVGGTCHAFRIDHCQFNLLKQYEIWIGGWVYGVVDHCVFFSDNTISVLVQAMNYGNVPYGDGSWAGPDDWGTTNAMYFEDCYFSGTRVVGTPAIDGDAGGRAVARFNVFTNVGCGFHGTESGGRVRGMRLFEIYNNTFGWQTNGGSAMNWAVLSRGGTGILFSNLFTGGVLRAISMAAYREYNSPWPYWGNVYPLNLWDTNYTTTYDFGNATSSTGATLTDSGKSWTVNQWVGYFVYNTNAANAFAITANTATTITTESGYHDIAGGVGANASFTSGDGYQIYYVRAILDQPGMGQGDLITGDSPVNSTTGTATWPHENFDPIYNWGNTMDYRFPDSSYGAPVNGGYPQTKTVVSGRDYIDGTPKPGYTPLVYPHPLVGAVYTNDVVATTNKVWLMPIFNFSAHP